MMNTAKRPARARYLTALGLIWLLASPAAYAQGTLLPLDNVGYHYLDRLSIKTGIEAPFHTVLKGYTRGDAARYALAIDTAQVPLSGRDRQDLYYLFRDNNEWLGQTTYATALTGKAERSDDGMTQVEASMADARYTESRRPILRHFYKTPANLFAVNEKHFHFRVNPVINFQLAAAPGDEQPVFANQRGADIRGGIDDRIYFRFFILESQARFPRYATNWIEANRALPGAGLFKGYQSEIFDIKNGYDFLNGQGYMGWNLTKHVGMQFGYGQNVIGNGIRSLLLSDFGNNYLNLKINWRVWRFHYQNIFAELAGVSARAIPGDRLVPKKYMAAHYLSFRPTRNIELGIFESIIFSRQDHFEFQYLNPFILYRLAEHGLGSPDNVLIGFDGKWNLFKSVQLYGQVSLDEFLFKELFIERRGWWANKYGIQAGIKYINALGIDHLDLQVEFNTVRPYTYTHRDSLTAYTHYNQPLAHPLGANFREMLATARYPITRRLLVEGRAIVAEFGEDDATSNWGGNLLLAHNARPRPLVFGNTTTQGIKASTLLLGLDVSYEVFHNVFFDFHAFYRRKTSDDPQRDLTDRYIGGGFRMNIGKEWRRFDF